MASALKVLNGYRKHVCMALGERARREQVDGDIAADLFLRELRGHQVPGRVIRPEIWRLYLRRYKGRGSAQKRRREGDYGCSDLRSSAPVQLDWETPLEILDAKEEEEIAQWICTVAKRVLPPKSWRVVSLWAHGATYEEIAHVAGYKNRQGAWAAVNRALAFLRAWVAGSVRQIEEDNRRR